MPTAGFAGRAPVESHSNPLEPWSHISNRQNYILAYILTLALPTRETYPSPVEPNSNPVEHAPSWWSHIHPKELYVRTSLVDLF